MPRFSEFFSLEMSQHQLDFVDVSNEFDTPVYVDPFAIEIRDDLWSAQASEHIRVFFQEVLQALRDDDAERATGLMSHLREPKETFLGVSSGDPKGRGVGRLQASQLISAIRQSKAYKSNLLSDLSEMALYVDGVDRDKISDLTTNIIRGLLVDYTQEQCEVFGIETSPYSGPAVWDIDRRNWVTKRVQLPYIGDDPILLVPKYIVRRKLSLDSQEFYNKQITDFLVAETLRANSSLVQTIKGKRKVLKGDVREAHPKSKSYIAEMVLAHPELLDLYKEIASKQGASITFDEDGPNITSVCATLARQFASVPTGAKHADEYHKLVLGSLTALFYPFLVQPRKEWEIHNGRKRVDIVYTNAADTGFFSHRRNNANINANAVVVECKNYTDDIGNTELDQLLGRFDNNRGKFGILTCRSVDNAALLLKRCKDAAVRSQGFVIVLTDADLVEMLTAKSELKDGAVEARLNAKFRELLA
ncbi:MULTISPECIES: hypothetical protein [unclassified Mesorhizobium]|uniref:hypothetical protein n=1 Tax=unclassified Mesorhizobium TaxID=325217 RepID=UPI000FCCC0C2|nr:MULTISPECIES: hypothetical protein [unclassified Mesorhizobium]TGU56907.1 hypothetical protein EN791_029685 [Mesorhizobium sp. M2D.F.Ca.ET.148.01.1.1]TGU61288.1 hypothetical protein EN790_29705 [Mesorhizobium sp. M2D.F.Ca.ET.147.01.1.1]